ncbi:GPI-anchored cell wall beta-1,3-endoglucanase EglC [Metarhizium album ARSEF 1941]|uniref:Probable glucan endo-1,3-beta-glucosidase eglC n=1 Tax=Metarhizium album (strain ARSEF 1941) TaxID=1081103 RepID=A0A0B2WWZ0_METAS|nr:GPI-anchored cell wall beta-1,3-endoglucanase EglC [Metarhizium album ARSEF 1941]KHN97947.1 GPI-anchored cell wall beta-1,3-endoglucanase EglC [Metarhizium album ARSEF 1941]
MLPRLLTLATAISGAAAATAIQGFNYGSTFSDNRPKTQVDFENEFRTAANLEGTNGAFTSARLFTTVQAGTKNDPISAIAAAISTKTSLLLGLWASAGEDAFNNELQALKTAIERYGSEMKDAVVGISVGSEDLYRASPVGQAASPDPGATAGTLAGYIKKVREVIEGTLLRDVPVGHVDTWTAYVDPGSKPVIDASDFIGMDAYPYFESTKPNGIGEAAKLFQAALDETARVSGGKPIWITESGWPVSGPQEGSAVTGLDDAQTFWRAVGCPRFGKVNVWWYALQDSAPVTPSPSFGVVGSTLTTKPLYDLSCDESNTASGKDAQSSKPAGKSQGSASSATQGSASSATQGSASSAAQDQVPKASGPAGTSVQGGSAQSMTAPAGDGSQQGDQSNATVAPPASNRTTLNGDTGSGSGTGAGGRMGEDAVNGSTTYVAPGQGTAIGASGLPSVTVPPNSGSKLNAFVGVAVGAVMAAAAL